MNSELAGRYYAQRHIPGTLEITVQDKNGDAVDLSSATEVRVYLAPDSVDWTKFSSFTQYSTADPSSRVTTGSAENGQVYFTYDPTVFSAVGEYKMGTSLITPTAPSGSLYPEFAWDTITIFSEFSKSIQQMMNRFRTILLMWSERNETIFASSNNFMDFELYTFLYEGMSFFNSYPPFTTPYTLSTVPESIEAPMFLCAALFALISMEIFEVGEHFQYNDNGLSFIREKSGKYAAVLGQITGLIGQTLPIMKKHLALSSLRIRGQFSGMVSMPRSLERALRGTRFYS